MKLLKVVAILAGIYVGIVVAFESLIGYFQPADESTLEITTFEGSEPHERIVARLETDGQIYVAANHWPRAWYRRALENPEVRVRLDGPAEDYRAVPLTGEERDRIAAAHRLPLFFRILTGFPPRHFLRLDPRPSS